MTMPSIGRLIVLACLCAGALACSQPASHAAPASATHTVAIEAVAFQPATLTVKVGDVIVWVNKDPFPHTVTSSTIRLDSGDIAPGTSWTWTATTAGSINYVCRYHPTMTGTVKVDQR